MQMRAVDKAYFWALKNKFLVPYCEPKTAGDTTVYPYVHHVDNSPYAGEIRVQ